MEEELRVSDMMTLFQFTDRAKFRTWVRSSYWHTPTRNAHGHRVWAASHVRGLWSNVYGVVPQGPWRTWLEQRYENGPRNDV